MPLFLTADERSFIRRHSTNGVTARLYWSTLSRVMRRAESPGLVSRDDTVEWWHVVEEAACDAAMMYALQPSPVLGAWVRNTTMGIVRRPESDWIGPWFRDHSRVPPAASLETAHITRAVAAAIDLAADVFTNDELEESRACLRDRAIPMAKEYLTTVREIHNYWIVVNAGLAMAAAVLNDRESMEQAASAYSLYCEAFQPDGTYAESLQYANYAAVNMALAYESLARRDESYKRRLIPETYAGIAKWAAYAHLYSKSLSGWGQEPVPRSINFGDSAAVFVPSAELLLHIAARTHRTRPDDARLARYLFDTVIDTAPAAPPHDRASFGFVNRPGFLTMPLLAHAVEAASPQMLDLSAMHAFDCGDVITRDSWSGRTTLALRTGGEPMNVVSHVHGDANSLILVHNRERLLVDPGHSCYRNLIHDLECSSTTHNTCTFQVHGECLERVQRGIANRKRLGDGLEPPLRSGSDRLLAASDGPIRVIASDASGRYGEPIEQFIRVCILCGSHVVFVVDQIRSSVPVRTRWNWLLNNRDGRAELKVVAPDQITFRRGDAGMKLFNASGATAGGPQYAYVHDAYHPLPNQLGEGAIGSGILIHWREAVASPHRVAIHAIALDDSGRIAGWNYRRDETTTSLTGHDGDTEWSLQAVDSSMSFIVTHRNSGDAWTIRAHPDGRWEFSPNS